MNDTTSRSDRRSFPVPALVAAGAALASCASTSAPAGPFQVDDSSRFSVQAVYTASELDAIELEDQFENTVDLMLNRDRIEARFEFGPERVGGKFFFFGEDLSWEFQGVESNSIDVYGIGGGMRGATIVAGAHDDDPATLEFVVPFDWNLAAAYGDDIYSIFYGELRAAVGFGIEWMGIQPSVGVTGSGLIGAIDDDFDDDNDDDEIDLSGVNVGGYAQVRYSPPEVPFLAHVRGSFGDVAAIEFGVGTKF